MWVCPYALPPNPRSFPGRKKELQHLGLCSLSSMIWFNLSFQLRSPVLANSAVSWLIYYYFLYLGPCYFFHHWTLFPLFICFYKTIDILQGFGPTASSSIKSLPIDLIRTFLTIPGIGHTVRVTHLVLTLVLCTAYCFSRIFSVILVYRHPEGRGVWLVCFRDPWEPAQLQVSESERQIRSIQLAKGISHAPPPPIDYS